jgi:predicted nuclease with TOPRIM domain
MKLKVMLAVFTAILLPAVAANAQVKPKPAAVSPVKGTAAYSEVLLQKAELTAELESLLSEYTEDYPVVKKLRIEVGLLQKEIDRLLAIAPTEMGKLSTALGKLMIRKTQAETELWKLRQNYADEHPDIKSAKRKVEIFEAAIREILN